MFTLLYVVIPTFLGIFFLLYSKKRTAWWHVMVLGGIFVYQLMLASRSTDYNPFDGGIHGVLGLIQTTVLTVVTFALAEILGWTARKFLKRT